MIKIISEYINSKDNAEEKRFIVKENESLKEYNTFKIGGAAELLVMPENRESLVGLIKIIKENNIKYYIIGNGSNVLIADKYFDGVFIILSRMNNYIEACGGEFIYAHSGVSLNRVACVARDDNMTGFEFAYGIPGTLGGAVVMNAGAYGGQMSDVIYSSEYIDLDNLEIKVIGNEAHDFGYRHSIFDENKIILSCCLKLNQGEKSEIEAAMQKNMSARKEKQPLEYPSAGSVFKRGSNYFTAQVIDGCGLKGASVGGAQVSEKHAGFIINKKDASFDDVINLIEYVKSVAFEKMGIKLEREVKIIE